MDMYGITMTLFKPYCNGCLSNVIIDWKRKLDISSDLEVLTTPHDVGRLYDSMDYIMCTGNVYDRPLAAA